MYSVGDGEEVFWFWEVLFELDNFRVIVVGEVVGEFYVYREIGDGEDKINDLEE